MRQGPTFDLGKPLSAWLALALIMSLMPLSGAQTSNAPAPASPAAVTITATKTDNSPATGYDATLVLPHNGLADPKACRYTGASWDCARQSFDASTVTRAGVTGFSQWAVGNGVPTAITLSSLSANTSASVAAWPATPGLAGLLALILGGLAWARARTILRS